MKIIAYMTLIFLLTGFHSHVFGASPHELKFHQLGILLGYNTVCLKMSGMDRKDPEAGKFGLHYGGMYSDLGQKGVQIFKQGVAKGIYAAYEDKGARCAKNLNRQVAMYRKIGLTGKFYLRALNALGGKKPPATNDSPAANPDAR